MDENLYDEFGNYIGPDIPGVDDDEIFLEHGDKSIEENLDDQAAKNNLVENEKYGITLYEDKNYYAEADEIYPGVENLVMEEDYQPLTEPMVAPIITKEFDLIEKKVPETNFDFDFLAGLMTRPE